MKPILNNACLVALLCGGIMVATPALAQLGGAAGAAVGGAGANAGVGVGPGWVIAGVNGQVATPRPKAIDRTTDTAQSTIDSGAGTTRRTVNQTGNSAAAELNYKAQANANAGASVSPGVTASGDVNSTDITNNAASVNRSTQTSAGKVTRQARANADATEAETTRQLNQQQTSVTASTTVQQ